MILLSPRHDALNLSYNYLIVLFLTYETERVTNEAVCEFHSDPDWFERCESVLEVIYRSSHVFLQWVLLRCVAFLHTV